MTTSPAQLEALLLASPSPVDIERLERHVGHSLSEALEDVGAFWTGRGLELRVKDGAAALVPSEAVLRSLSREKGRNARRLSDAAVETLAFIALRQPVTVAEIEKARGVALFKGLMESLLDAGFVRASMRKSDAGRAIAYVTTDALLDHFGLSSLADFPTPEELAEFSAAAPSDDRDAAE